MAMIGESKRWVDDFSISVAPLFLVNENVHLKKNKSEVRRSSKFKRETDNQNA